MEFDKSRVYTTLNAYELKIGSKCIFADDLGSLKDFVYEGSEKHTYTLVKIESSYYEKRFCNGYGDFALAYLVEEPKESRRMTNRELAKWLAQGNGQWRSADANLIGMSYSYGMYEDTEEVLAGIMIRGWDEAEWHEPVIKED